MTKLTYEWVNDETAEVQLDGDFIGTVDHTTYGWEGITGVQKILNSVATLQGWDIEEKEFQYDEED